MKIKFLLLLSVCINVCYAQTTTIDNPLSLPKNTVMKGKLYLYWGWNRGYYTNSDIQFKGENYNFTLKNVVAEDRPTKFDPAIYFNPLEITIPQFNFRIGYFFSNHWDISIGTDHMKYDVRKGQSVKISGKIMANTTYDGNYNNNNIVLSDDFLLFEHTDGLNYVNSEIRRFDQIFVFGKMKINLTEGLGLGFLYPKTNTTLFGEKRYNDFNFSGYGFSSTVGLNFLFFDRFFIQSELKGGYINMPNIRTTNSTKDRASLDFFYGQFNIVFGGLINLN